MARELPLDQQESMQLDAELSGVGDGLLMAMRTREALSGRDLHDRFDQHEFKLSQRRPTASARARQLFGDEQRARLTRKPHPLLPFRRLACTSRAHSRVGPILDRLNGWATPYERYLVAKSHPDAV